MQAFSINELCRLTRRELFVLHARVAAELPALPANSVERAIAFDNLRLIRSVLSERPPLVVGLMIRCQRV
jgi:hypothetical protein